MKNNILKHYIEVPDNLFALLSRYRVVITGIQRHYVQGANNPKAESVRKQFIKEIFTAIEKKQNEFNLHFIYGPINTNGEDSFVPVDGQQRLTTLWLIARYAVEKAEPSNRKELLRLLSRFTYEDRINAKRFCQALTCEDSRWDITQDPNPDILCQDWFVDYWKEDETVASMIRMLSTIHEEWNKHQDSITAEDILEAIASKIRFNLKIDAFGDDIYMKMNARGLQLTQWENFKGKFSEDLCEDKKSGGLKRWKSFPIVFSLVQTNNTNCRIMLSSLCMHESWPTKRKKLAWIAVMASRNLQHTPTIPGVRLNFHLFPILIFQVSLIKNPSLQLLQPHV